MPTRGEILHGGNFYGGHVGFAMDALKTLVANVADLLDRQLALLCNPLTSAGLPANLVGAGGRRAATVHHGFKAMGITASRADGRGAEADHARERLQPQHREPQPGQGQHGHDRRARLPAHAGADRDRRRSSSCSRCARRSDLRGPENCKRRSRILHGAVRALVPRIDGDRRQDVDISGLLALYRRGELPIGGADAP